MRRWFHRLAALLLDALTNLQILVQIRVTSDLVVLELPTSRGMQLERSFAAHIRRRGFASDAMALLAHH